MLIISLENTGLTDGIAWKAAGREQALKRQTGTGDFNLQRVYPKK